MRNFALVDAMYRDGFFCPISNLIMGQTAEVLARHYDISISRDESDAFALGSQQKAEAAAKAWRFADEIAPIAIEGRKGEKVLFATDEHPRAASTIEGLKKLPLVFAEVKGRRASSRQGPRPGLPTAARPSCWPAPGPSRRAG